MNPQEALNLLVGAVEHGNKSGIYTLSDSVNIVNAINTLQALIPIPEAPTNEN
jgi:hypothetical protein